MARSGSRLSALVLVLVLLLIGCEVGSGPVTGSPLSAEPSIPDTGVTLSPPGTMTIQGSPLAAARTIPNTGITLSPPGTKTSTVSADRAYDLCRNHVAECDPGPPTAVELALMTDTSSNIVANDTLVWVFSWLGSDSCFFSGGGNPAPNTPAVTPRPTCDEFAFIDARTDTFYFTYTHRHQ